MDKTQNINLSHLQFAKLTTENYVAWSTNILHAFSLCSLASYFEPLDDSSLASHESIRYVSMMRSFDLPSEIIKTEIVRIKQGYNAVPISDHPNVDQKHKTWSEAYVELETLSSRQIALLDLPVRELRQKACTMIFQTVSPEIALATNATSIKHPLELWDTLHKYCNKNTFQVLTQLERDFFSTHQESDESGTEFIARVQKLFLKLTTLNSHLAVESFLVRHTILMIHKRYKVLHTQLRDLLKDPATSTFTAILEVLAHFDTTYPISHPRQSSSFHAHSNRDSSNRRNTRPNSKPARKKPSSHSRTLNDGAPGPKDAFCRYCKAKDHVITNCPVKKALHCDKCGSSGDHRTAKCTKYTAHLAFLAKRSTSTPTDAWIQDSGATSHMTFDRSDFHDFSEITDNTIQCAVGDALPADGIGSVRLVTPTGTLIELKDVLYIPSLNARLFSTIRLLESFPDFHLSMGNKVSKFTSSTGKTLFTSSQQPSGLFTLDLDRSHSRSQPAIAFHVMKLWHRRYGHLNQDSLRRLTRDSLVTGLPDLHKCKSDSCICPTCALTKSTYQNPTATSKTSVTQPLARIHMDLCGPIQVPTAEGFKYFITFTDEYSRYSWISFLRTKDQAFSAFCEFQAYIENRLKCKILGIRSDNGTEFINRAFLDHLRKGGIAIQHSAPDTQAHNGIAERLNRTLKERARSMLHDADISSHFWHEAIRTANYLRNLSPSSAIGHAIPHTRLFGEKPSVSHLRVFGSICYVHIHNKSKSLFSPKAYQAKLVGYDPHAKAYRVLRLDTCKVMISAHVRFDETEIQPATVTIPATTSLPQVSSPPVTLPPTITEKPAAADIDIALDNRASEALVFNLSEQSIALAPVSGTQSELEFIFADLDSAHDPDSSFDPTDLTSSPRSSTSDASDSAPPRRSTRTSEPPARFTLLTIDGPPHVAAALRGSDKPHWLAAINDELASLAANKTWTLVPCPANKSIVGSRWVFKLKLTSDGRPDRYKARLVAQGFTQIPGQDFKETFAPVAKMDTIRLILAIAAQTRMVIHQMDVKTAFLNGDIEEEIYMRQPPGFKDKSHPDHVCRLTKCIYGLKQAPRMWNQKLNDFLCKEGFSPNKYDACLYSKTDSKGNLILILVYVDDILIACSALTTILEIKLAFQRTFKMTDLGLLSSFLGLQIDQRSDGSIEISQPGYTETIINRFNLASSPPLKTPLSREDQLWLLQEHDSIVHDKSLEIRQLIGSLLYLSMCTRPDITYAVAFLCRYADRCDKFVYSIGLKIVRYLVGNPTRSIRYHTNPRSVITGWVDSSFADDINDRKSTSGYIFLLGPSPISWKSIKQSCVAASTTEAEYIATSEVTKQALFYLNIARKVLPISAPILINVDNTACIDITKDPNSHSKTKHIAVRYHVSRQAYERNQIDLRYCKSHDNIADFFTKPLSGKLFKKHSESIFISNHV